MQPDPEVEYEEYIPDTPAAGHAGILQNFTNAVLYGEQLLAPGTDGIFELTISNAAYLSAWTGNSVVNLPPDTAAFDEKLAELAEQSRLRQNPASEAINTEYRARWQVQW